jgi:glycosyltransferase involved in cell wall biosynthesis
MKIAYVCADHGIPLLGFKGASTHVREIASGLAARGHGVVVTCSRVGSGNPDPPVDRIAVLPNEPDEQERFLGTLLHTERIDAVLERYSLEGGTARQVTRRFGIPLVLEVNAPLVLEASRYRGLVDVEEGMAREKRAFESADAIVVVSGALAAHVEKLAPRTPFAIVPNGVDPSRFAGCRPAPLGLPEGATAIGFVGSMKRWHGIAELLEAFRSVAQGHPEVHLVLAGSGPEDQTVQRVADDPAVRGRIHVLGALAHDRIPRVLAALSVAVAPYHEIPDFYFCPLKVLEYMAAGLPIAFSNVGDLPEIVDGAGVGYPAGNVTALAQSMTQLVEDAELRQRLGESGRARSLLYTWDRAAAAVEAVLRSTTPRNGRKEPGR